MHSYQLLQDTSAADQAETAMDRICSTEQRHYLIFMFMMGRFGDR